MLANNLRQKLSYTSSQTFSQLFSLHVGTGSQAFRLATYEHQFNVNFNGGVDTPGDVGIMQYGRLNFYSHEFAHL